MREIKEWKMFSERVRAELSARDMTQRELAKLSGLNEASVSQYINLFRVPRATAIIDIAKALNVSCDYLLGVTNDRRTKVWGNQAHGQSDVAVHA